MHITDDRLPMDQNGTREAKSPVVKRSIVVAGHKTSVSLEDAFWAGLKEIAGGRHLTLSDMVAAIDSERRHGNLSSAIRLFVLDFYRRQLSELKAGGPAAHDMMGRGIRAFS
jgi:predicted DNA-binding ribbon-helix-helix protein